ncbi:iron permease FTR1 family-domain-containing protein [Chytriomyces cf. hyalinus JEL632]|nr:iron permease FTR1 family-domain-containing protein [Chytriomyces cf. hyalinus JEL632]
MAVGFSVPVFIVILRECTEAAIVISVLLAFVTSMFKHDLVLRRRLMVAVWLGSAAGIVISGIIGTIFLVLWFKYANNLWTSAEALWEACFSLLATVLLSGMALVFLKSDTLTEKWQRKLEKSLRDNNVILQGQNSNATLDEATGSFIAADAIEPTEKDSKKSEADAASEVFAAHKKIAQVFFWVPLVTILREGIEGMFFLGGISISSDPGTIPLAALTGLAVGCIIGWLIFRAGNSMKLHVFFVSASILIFYLAAGLFSKSVGSFEVNTWMKQINAAGDDLAYYNVFTSVWHLTCCNPSEPNSFGWQIFGALLGWTNGATVGTIVSYIVYWLVIAVVLVSMKLLERRRVRLGLEKIGFKKRIKQMFMSTRV